jgi:holo-[acyl-carrier protein] synthase
VPVVGVGIDVVDVARFAGIVDQTPSVAQRVLSEREMTARRPEGWAARFAAKEALAKALGRPSGLRWQDAQVVTAEDGRPSFELTGTVAEAAQRLGVHNCHLSLTHDAGVAVALVVAES